MATTVFRQDENLKNLISEISALSGYPQNIIKEVLEYLLIDWSVKIADNPNNFAGLEIPYLGKVFVKYAGDEIQNNGKLITKVDSYVELKESFTSLLGQIHDESWTEVQNILSKKIESAVMVASTPE